MKTRSLHTKIWLDDWFSELSTADKLLFVYLLTNSHINLNGAYELTDRVLLFETGVSREQLTNAKEKFKDKIAFYDNWIVIKNVDKYDDFKGGKLLQAKENQLKEIPAHIIEFINQYRTDTLSIPYDTPNSNSNSNSKVIGVVKGKHTKFDDITEEDISEIAYQYSIDTSFVRLQREALKNYCESHGKKYKDYKATLRNFVLKAIERNAERRSYGTSKVSIDPNQL